MLSDPPSPMSQRALIERCLRHLDSGRIAQAEQVLAGLRGLPPHPDLAWLRGRCALARAERGDLSTAEDGISGYLEAQGWPSSPEPTIDGVGSWRSTYELGLLLLLSEAYEESEAQLQEAERWRPCASVARLARLELWIRTGRAAAALSELQTGEGPDGQVLRAWACVEVGDLDQARRIIATPIGGDCVSGHRAALLLAIREQLGAEATPAGWGTLEALILGVRAQVNEVPSEETVDDVVGQLAESDDALSLGALLTRRANAMLPGLRAQVLSALERRGLQWEDTEPDFIFVGGAGRSGTTLFRSMLGAHPHIHCGPEAKLVPVMGAFCAQLHRGFDAELRAAGIEPALIDRALRAFLETFLRGLHPVKRIAEKTPENLIYTELLGSLFPNARFIHVVRDGRAVVESLLRQKWLRPDGRRVAYTQDTTLAARYWRDTVRAAHAQSSSVPGRFLELRYEQLVADPRGQMSRVLEFLGEPWDDAVLHAGAALSGRESSSASVAGGLRTDRTEAWRTLTPGQLAEIEAEAGPLLAALGYTGAA